MNRPRYTDEWQRLRLPELWQQFLDQPEVRHVAQDAVDLYTVVWMLMKENEADPRVDALLEPYWEHADRLTALAERLAPDLAGFFGDELRAAVHRLLAGPVVQHFEGLPAAQAAAQQLPQLHAHRWPGTGLDLTKPILPGTSQHDVQVLKNVLKSYEPETRGRKPGATVETDDKARKAWALRERGMSRDEICRKLTGADKKTDEHYGTWMRQIDRWIARGRDLAATADN